jgi:hypothetical protein
MRKLFILILLGAVNFAAHAQPTLTAANSNPVLGDVFYNYYSDTSTIFPGPSGAGVTWDFSYITVSTRDTTTLVTCSVTPYCDSFPGSTIVEFTGLDSAYVYLAPSTATLEYLGGYMPVDLGGVNFVYLPIPSKMGPYPKSYGSTWRDTNYQKYDVVSTSMYDHTLFAQKSTADGYGTLITPQGTYTNVLRVHTTSISFDTNFYYNSSGIDTNESYKWYAQGCHTPLLTIVYSVYTSFGGSPDIEFSTMYYPEAVPHFANIAEDFQVYPNPTSEFIHVKNEQGNLQNVEISLCDITGREVWKSEKSTMQNQDELVIPVSLFASGIYLLRIQTESGSVIKKLEIDKR